MFRQFRNILTDEVSHSLALRNWGGVLQLDELEQRCVFAPVIAPIEASPNSTLRVDGSPTVWSPRAPLSYHDVLLSAEIGNKVDSYLGDLEALRTFSPSQYPHHDLIQLSGGQLVEFWSSSEIDQAGIWMSYKSDGVRTTQKIAIPVVATNRSGIDSIPIAATVLDGDGFAVIWSDAYGVRGMTFANLEAEAGASFVVSSSPYSRITSFDIIGLAQGFSVGWADPYTGSVLVKDFNAQGEAMDTSYTLVQGSGSTSAVFELQWTRAGHDTAVLVWSESDYRLGESQFQHWAQAWNFESESGGQRYDLGRSSGWSPPSLAIDQAGRWALAELEVDGLGTARTSFKLLQADGSWKSGTLLWEGSLHSGIGTPAIVALPGGGFAVAYFAGEASDTELRITTITATGQQLDDVILANNWQDDVSGFLKVVVAQDRTITVQWISANIADGDIFLLQQSCRKEFTPLNFRFAGPPPALIDLESDPFFQLYGDAELLLAAGESYAPGEWWLSLNEIDWIAVTSRLPEGSFAFELGAYDPLSPDEPFHWLSYQVGTADDDLIYADSYDVTYIAGGDGIDTAYVEGYSFDFEFIEDAGILVGRDFFYGITTNYFEGIEFLEFYDGVYSVEEALGFADANWDWLQGLYSDYWYDDGSYWDDDYDVYYDEFYNEYQDEYDDELGEFSEQVASDGYQESADEDSSGEEDSSAVQSHVVDLGSQSPRIGPVEVGGMRGESPLQAAQSVRFDVIDLVFGHNAQGDQGQEQKQDHVVRHVGFQQQAEQRMTSNVQVPVPAHNDGDLCQNLQPEYRSAERSDRSPSVSDPEIVSAALEGPPAFDEEALWERVEAIEEARHTQIVNQQVVAGTAVVVAVGFSTSQIAWLLRGSAMLSKLCSSMPVWISFDPLPLLEGSGPPINSLRSHPHESLADIIMAQQASGMESSDATT